MNAKWIGFLGACLLGSSLLADTLTLSDGTQMQGTVRGFKERKFEFESDKGVKNSYALNAVRRIEFKAEGEEKGVVADLTYSDKGQFHGRVTELSGGNFRFFNAQGKEQTLPAWLVTSATFASAQKKEADSTTANAKTAGSGEKGKFEVLTHGERVDLEKKLASGKATMIDFYADWCGPCRQMAPILEDIVAKNPSIALKKVDIVKWDSEVSKQYGIRSVPQIWFYSKEGKLVGKFAGGSGDDLMALVAKVQK